MIKEIVSQQEFKKLVKEVAEDQLLIFYDDNSDRRLVNRYKIIALSVANELQRPITIFQINLNNIQLTAEDKEEYQVGNNTICCTTINDGVLMEKQVNPFETTARQMVRNILI